MNLITDTIQSKRKGMASILGTLLFIAILFSAIIPMKLMMKQADNHYEKEKLETERIDDKKNDEDLLVYAYNGTDETQLYVKIKNQGTVNTVIERVWINDDYYSVSQEEGTIGISKSQELGPYNVNITSNQKFRVKAVTSRGNIIYSSTGTLIYDGGWITPSCGIVVHILNEQGRYNITIYNSTEQVYSYTSQGTEHEDVITSTEVENNEEYQIIVEKQGSGIIEDMNVTMAYPGTSPIMYVFVNALNK